MENIKISTDKNLLDLDFLHQFLSNTYWAKGRTREDIQMTIEHCVCFGLYKNDQQIGFARVLTDYAVFAYLMDVFITEQERGKGYATRLMDAVFSYPGNSNVKKWKLGTNDAHGLYRKFGFEIIKEPAKMMERIG